MFFVLFFTVTLAGVVASQPSTNSICRSTWSFNSLGQSPCLVSAYLGSGCNSGTFFVPTLLNNLSVYVDPSASEAKNNSCGCSSVFYSLLGACAERQSADIPTWSDFSGNCKPLYLQKFVGDIPPGTAVPHWAYQDVTVENRFNSTLAQLQLSGPESTAGAQPSQTPVLPSSSAASESAANAQPIGTGSPLSTSAPKKLDVKSIVGGVVGGVALSLLVFMAAIWLIRRRRKGFVAPTLDPLLIPSGYTSTGEIISVSVPQRPKIHKTPQTSSVSETRGHTAQILHSRSTVEDQPPEYTEI
ncbi:hypothetical protein MVEN_00209900 [Mycena venus]|uniref:Uncharacterized protein n=1 Tax=Mycena venus TaxID=2733690 RepID=A0A8H7DBZ8_9AGAR|nr:hypothetical protein MVEN_00209900 [Mycena venus]